MSKIQNIFKLIINSDFRFLYLSEHGFYKKMPDEKFLIRKYKAVFHSEPNLKNPQTFNEKVNWLKLHKKNWNYSILVDKYKMKEILSPKIGSQFFAKTLGKWSNFDEIDFSLLPNKFVLKCNHDSGSVVVCKDKSIFNFKKARKKLMRGLKKNYFWGNREYPYQQVSPCIFAEEYIELDDSNSAEYKFFCYNGKVDWVMACTGKAHTEERSNDGFDVNFNHLPVSFTYPNSKKKLEKPLQWEQMIELAEKLSEGIIQVRVDFMLVNNKLLLGEMTFFHDAGLCVFKPGEWDEKLGRNLILPKE